MRPSWPSWTLAVQVQLSLGWILTCFSILIFWTLCGKPTRGRQKALFYQSLFFGGAWTVGGWGVVGWGRKSYLGPAERFPAGILAEAVSMTTSSPEQGKHDTFRHVISTGYFYVLLLWTISVSDFCLLEIYKILGFPLSIITFTVNSHADNHFYKYIYLFQISYSLKSIFFIKYTLRFWPKFFIFKYDLNVKHRSYIFYKKDGLQKKNSTFLL